MWFFAFLLSTVVYSEFSSSEVGAYFRSYSFYRTRIVCVVWQNRVRNLHLVDDDHQSIMCVRIMWKFRVLTGLLSLK